MNVDLTVTEVRDLIALTGYEGGRPYGALNAKLRNALAHTTLDPVVFVKLLGPSQTGEDIVLWEQMISGLRGSTHAHRFVGDERPTVSRINVSVT